MDFIFIILFLIIFVTPIINLKKNISLSSPMGQNVEQLYMKKEKDILKSVVKDELEKNNFDKTKTITYIDNRKFKLTIIF